MLVALVLVEQLGTSDSATLARLTLRRVERRGSSLIAERF